MVSICSKDMREIVAGISSNDARRRVCLTGLARQGEDYAHQQGRGAAATFMTPSIERCRGVTSGQKPARLVAQAVSLVHHLKAVRLQANTTNFLLQRPGISPHLFSHYQRLSGAYQRADIRMIQRLMIGQRYTFFPVVRRTSSAWQKARRMPNPRNRHHMFKLSNVTTRTGT